MNVQYIVTAYFLLYLTDSFKERQTFNIAYGAADFGNYNISIISLCHIIYALLYLICNVRNNLNGLAKVITAALFRKNIPVNLTCSNIGMFGKADVNKRS